MILKLPGTTKNRMAYLPLDQIRISGKNARRVFDEYEIIALGESIRSNGLINPLSVRRLPDGGYELVAGERRLRAMRLIGQKTACCIVFDRSERDCRVISLVENLQRRELSFFEQAEGIERLISEFCMPYHEAAMYLGMAQSTISNKLKLLQLDPDQRARISAAGLGERHARAVVSLPPELREEALDRIIAGDLNVRETEALTSRLIAPPPEEKKPLRTAGIGDIRIFTNSLNRMIDTMRRAGYTASATKSETEGYVEYTVRIVRGTRAAECTGEALALPIPQFAD